MTKHISIILVFIYFLLSNNTSYGQQEPIDGFINEYNRITHIDFGSNSINIVGSRYINEGFLPGIFAKNNKVYLFRYNAYLDEMEFQIDNKKYALIRKFNSPIVFTISNKKYQVYEYPTDEKVKEGYFVVLFVGDKLSLLLREKIIFQSEVKAKSSYHEYKPASLVRSKDKLFIGYKNNKAAELPKKKKDFFALFSSKSKEVEKHAKSNGLSIKKTDDLVKIFTYYDSLK